MSSELKRSSEIVWEELDGAAVLVNPHAGQTWVLNESAACVWKMCDGRNLEEIALLLARETGQELRRIKADLRAFVQQLRGHGILVASASASFVNAAGLQHCFSGPYLPPAIRPHNHLSGFRGRPSSRGFSGPG